MGVPLDSLIGLKASTILISKEMSYTETVKARYTIKSCSYYYNITIWVNVIIMSFLP